MAWLCVCSHGKLVLCWAEMLVSHKSGTRLSAWQKTFSEDFHLNLKSRGMRRKRKRFHNSSGKGEADNPRVFFFFFSSCTQWSNFISVWNGKGGCLFRLRTFSNDFNTHWNLWAKYSRDKVCNEDLSSQLKFQSQWKCYLIPSPYFQFLYLCSVFTFMIGGLVHHFSRENYSFSGSQQWNQTGWSSCLKIRFIKPTDTSDLKSRR